MAKIENEEAARRLARAICADITLYNGDKIASRADLTPEYLEGRELYVSRVTPELQPIFDAEVASGSFGQLVRVGAVPPPALVEPRAPARLESAPAPSSSNAGLLVVGGLLLLTILAAVGYFLTRR